MWGGGYRLLMKTHKKGGSTQQNLRRFVNLRCKLASFKAVLLHFYLASLKNKIVYEIYLKLYAVRLELMTILYIIEF